MRQYYSLRFAALPRPSPALFPTLCRRSPPPYAGALFYAAPSLSASLRCRSYLRCAGALSYPSPDVAQSRQLKYLDLRSILYINL